jgi:hypothetical protein
MNNMPIKGVIIFIGIIDLQHSIGEQREEGLDWTSLVNNLS